MIQSSSPLHIYGIFHVDCGYRSHALGFARALSRRRDVRLRSVEGRLRESSLPEDLRGLLEADQDSVPNVALCIGGIDDFPRTPGRFRIGYAVFETTRLPSRLLKAIRGLDAVWVPSSWCRAQLVEQGIGQDKIRVVPEGVDTEKFSPGAIAREKKPFRFLSVGKWEKRKCQEDLIRVFIETFDERENVELIIHGHNPFMPGFSLERAIDAAKGRARHRIVASSRLSEHELIDLYSRSDAFVLPTRGEAWGLPITEAMSVGLPVIVTATGGPMDFIQGDHALSIPVKTMKRVWDRASYRPSFRYGRWAEPDWKALASLMRRLVDESTLASDVGRRARQYAQKHLTWDVAADAACSALEAIERGRDQAA